MASSTIANTPIFKKVRGRFRVVGSTNMRAPHDPAAPVEQLANCNCDITFIVRRRNVKKKVQKSLLYCSRQERMVILKSFSSTLTRIVNRLKKS